MNRATQSTELEPGRPRPGNRPGVGPAPKLANGGFTLVEIALAIMVVVIGVFSVFALLSAGLDQSAKAVADTHTAKYANAVFHGLRSYSLAYAEKDSTADSSQWRGFWINFATGATNIPVQTVPAWADMGMVVRGNGNIYTQLFRDYSFRRTTLETNIIDHALRYRVYVATNIYTAVSAIVTTYVNTQYVFGVTLKVWEGEFGMTADTNAHLYYSEYANPGNL